MIYSSCHQPFLWLAHWQILKTTKNNLLLSYLLYGSDFIINSFLVILFFAIGIETPNLVFRKYPFDTFECSIATYTFAQRILQSIPIIFDFVHILCTELHIFAFDFYTIQFITLLYLLKKRNHQKIRSK